MRADFRLPWKKLGAVLKGSRGKAVFDREEGMEEKTDYSELEIIAGIPLVSGNAGKGKPDKKACEKSVFPAAELA